MTLLYELASEYKVHLLDQYDKPYPIKIVKYQHKEITYLNTYLQERGAASQQYMI